MTTRSVFVPKETKPYYTKVPVDFAFSPGLSPLQKKKNVKALHDAFTKTCPGKKVLEVSTKSDSAFGESLSPFNLTRTLPTLKKEFPVENIYHASKAWPDHGPYYDLLGTTPAMAKQDRRTAGAAEHYHLEGKEYPARPDLLFYNWIYSMALLENNKGRELLNWDAFTDIEFPNADGNCQARACAIACSLLKQGKLKRDMSFDEFSDLFMDSALQEERKKTLVPATFKEAAPPARRTTFAVGDWLMHPNIGQGQVMKKTGRDYTISFRVSGPKTLRKEIVETRCTKL